MLVITSDALLNSIPTNNSSNPDGMYGQLLKTQQQEQQHQQEETKKQEQEETLESTHKHKQKISKMLIFPLFDFSIITDQGTDRPTDRWMDQA